MKLNSKLTGGLAWAGLILVLAVPSADILTKGQGGAAAHVTSDMDAVKTATTTESIGAPLPVLQPAIVEGQPAAIETATTGDPVDTYLEKGKKLPSYISDAPTETASAEPATTPRVITPSGSTATEEPDEMQVASVDSSPTFESSVAPIPYPAEKRPTAPVMTASVAPASVSEEEPLILDENLVARRDAAVTAVLDDEPLPIAPSTVAPNDGFIENDELEEWDSGSLADYLERRGLLNGGDSEYDEDGFFLDEGPNNDNRPRRRERERSFFLF